jgi:molecular chaperone HscC
MIVGIDLGTTNSLVAVWQDGRARTLPNALGEVLTPSCVSVDDDGSILVGRAARERLQTHPDRTAAVFKRYMGSDRVLRLADRDFRPEELSALVLRSLKADAEAALGEPVTEAIISVPAYFSDAQRKATRAAGQLAGLKVERLLNEPTAAGLAYGLHQRDRETRFLVFDLGGGTFDVSVLELFEGVMEVRASAGDNLLGGEDFLAPLVELFFERTGLSPELRRDRRLMHRLLAEAERAKRTLSAAPEATLRVRVGEVEHAATVDEATLERIGAPVLARIRHPVERALRDARLRAGELDAVVLAGGATRMPMVRRLVTTLFGRFPLVELDPDQVVALGAAVQAGLKAKDLALREVVMTDVAPYSMGVEVAREVDGVNVARGLFDPVIERNGAVPVSRVKRYFPLQDQQARIDLRIHQGEARLASDNIPLGRLEVPLPGLPRAESGVDVRFTYDVNGLLQVEATVLATGCTSALVIQGNPGLLTDEEIARRLAALSDLKIHPRDRLENRTALARAERLYEQLLSGAREGLGAVIERFEAALAAQDRAQADGARRLLEQVLDQLEGTGPLADAPPPPPPPEGPARPT